MSMIPARSPEGLDYSGSAIIPLPVREPQSAPSCAAETDDDPPIITFYEPEPGVFRAVEIDLFQPIREAFLAPRQGITVSLVVMLEACWHQHYAEDATDQSIKGTLAGPVAIAVSVKSIFQDDDDEVKP